MLRRGVPRAVLDLRMVSGRLHGIARYALELARRLPALLPEWELVGLGPPEGLPGDLGPLAPSLPVEPCRASFLSPLEQPALWASLRRLKPDLFHATSFSLPALWSGRLVATLHDANHLALPEHYGPAQRAYYRWIVGPRARRARAILTVSEFSRRELARYLGLPAASIQVTPLGVSDLFRPPPPEAVATFRDRYRLPPRYFVAVGNPKPHKNLGLLAKIAADLPSPIVLLAGRGAAANLGYPASTLELGELPEADLPLLYAGAVALLLPSLYEGFGLPALEAMASGCPVVAARATALAEWVEGAGMLLDPHAPNVWLEACRELDRDSERLRPSLIERGLRRARDFSWERCAAATAQAYRTALSAPVS